MRFNLFSCVYGDIVIQQHYILAFMTFMAIVNCYNVRMCLSIAITEIADPIIKNETSVTDCPGNLNSSDLKGGSYHWSERQQAFILMGFYPGYLIMHLPGGILADKYGGRHALSLGVLGSAIITILTPVIIQKLNWGWLVASRFALGLAQASMYPAITSLLARWIPPAKRSHLGALVYSGIQVGIITGTLFSGLMIHYFKSWPVIFYVWGILCLVWYIFFLFMCFSEPDTHPFITPKEKEMLDAAFGHRQKFKTPWKAILKDSSVWALILAQCGHDWITYLIEIDMPKYFKSVLKVDVHHNGIIQSVPFALMWVCSAATGYLSDYFINKRKVKPVTMRIIYTTIASVGPSTLTLLATYMGCHLNLAVSFFWLGLISMGPYYPGLKVNVLDLSANFSGLLMSLANGIGVIPGIVAPYLVAEMAKNQTLREWRNCFWISWVFCTVTNIVYIIWASGERREWDFSPEVAEPAHQE